MSMVRVVPTHRRRLVASRRGLFMVLVAAIGIGSVTAFLFARHRSYASPSQWSPMVLLVADAGAGARGADAHDGGADLPRLLKGGSEGQERSKANQSAVHPENAVGEPKQTSARDSGKKVRSKKSRRVEYTPEGSPLLW